MLSDDDVSGFHASGVRVLRGFFDPGPLDRQVDSALADGIRPGTSTITGDAGIAFRYVPMMSHRTPASLALLDALAIPAAQLLGGAVIPTRAKGTRYFGATPWHRDSESRVVSAGFAAY